MSKKSHMSDTHRHSSTNSRFFQHPHIFFNILTFFSTHSQFFGTSFFYCAYTHEIFNTITKFFNTHKKYFAMFFKCQYFLHFYSSSRSMYCIYSRRIFLDNINIIISYVTVLYSYKN